MLVNGIKTGIQNVFKTIPTSLSYGAKGMSYGLLAHHSITSNGLLYKNIFTPIGHFFRDKLGVGAASEWVGQTAFPAVKGFLGDTLGLSAAKSWIGENLVPGFAKTAADWIGTSFSTIMGKTALESSLLAPFIGASTLTIGNIAAVGAAIPLIGLVVNGFRKLAAKRAAQAAAELAAKQAAQQTAKATGRTIAIAGGGLAAGALGTAALTAGPALEAGQNLSKLV